MTEFWTTLIKVHSSVEGNTALDENCTHVIGPYYIMEGETEFLAEEGVKFDDVAEGAVGALGDRSTEELIAICLESYGVDLGESMTHPLERRLKPDATEDQQRDFYVGAYEACRMLLTSPRMKKAQIEIIEEMAHFVIERLEALGVSFNA